MRVDPNYVQNLTTALNSSSGTEQTLTQQLSSGLRISKLSDDPVVAAQNALLSSQIGSVDSFVQNATKEQGLLQVTDSALGQVVTDLTSAISLGTQAGNDTLSATNLQSIAAQVSSLRDSVLTLANTNYLGQYIFSGSKGNTASYTLDGTTDPAVATYNGDTATQHVATPGGQNIQLNLPGSAIFSASGADVFGTLNQLVSDLTSGNTTGIQADVASLTNSLTNVSTQRSILGGSQARLNATSSYSQTQEAELTAQQSTLIAADPANVATSLQTAEVQHQALLNVIAGLSRTNLFSVLQ
jgi:flagellar hook-associated protein 3 FlgL